MSRLAYIQGMAKSTEIPKSKIMRLKKRSDFLRLRRGHFEPRAGFLLQACRNDQDIIRVGFTCSKKIGNAVMRNRAKRRLRALSDIIIPQYGRLGWDYVFIGKREVTAMRNFEKLAKDAQSAFSKIHEPRESAPKLAAKTRHDHD